MTFLLGIYAVLMMVVLPGAILLRIISLRSAQSFTLSLFLPLCFGLSLLFNYFLVLFLVLLHGYTPVVIRSIGIIEGLLLVFAYRHSGRVDLVKKFAFEARFLFVFAWLLLCCFSVYWLLGWGNVFGGWDPTVSYNLWATEWAHNTLPSLTWHYPQLLPSNWSLVYVMIGPLPEGVHLEVFPAAIQGFFFIGMLLFLLDAFYQKREPVFLLSLVLLALFLSLFFFSYLLLGYADLPVSFFNFGAVLLLLRGANSRTEQRWLLRFSLLFALAAALTKPAGIYTALVIPLLHYKIVEQKSLRHLSCTYAGLLLLIVPWYFYASIDETNYKGFADIFFLVHTLIEGAGFFSSFVVFLVSGLVPLVLLIFVFLFKERLSASLKIILYAYTPYFFIWLFAFSYDPRNLIFLWPILCLLTAFVAFGQPLFRDLSQAFKKRILSAFPLWLIPLLLLGIALIASTQTSFQEPALIAHQIKQKNNTYDPDVMLRLEAYALCPHFKGKILTNSAYFEYIPLLAPYITPFTPAEFGSNMEPNVFVNPKQFGVFMQNHPDIHYLLLDRRYPLQFEPFAFTTTLQQWQQEHKITLQWQVDGIELYQLTPQ